MLFPVRHEAEREDPRLGAAGRDALPRRQPHARGGAEAPAAAQDRQERRAGLLHLPEHHVQADEAGGARGGDPEGPGHAGQAEERSDLRARAPRQAHPPGREALRGGRYPAIPPGTFPFPFPFLSFPFLSFPFLSFPFLSFP
ncbi:hypothetical protein RLOC_00007336, partial [Lonchura striata]